MKGTVRDRDKERERKGETWTERKGHIPSACLTVQAQNQYYPQNSTSDNHCQQPWL